MWHVRVTKIIIKMKYKIRLMSKKTPKSMKIAPDVTVSKRSFGARLRGYFIAGILVVAPISITIYLTYLFLTAIDSQVAKFFPQSWYEHLYGNNVIPDSA